MRPCANTYSRIISAIKTVTCKNSVISVTKRSLHARTTHTFTVFVPVFTTARRRHGVFTVKAEFFLHLLVMNTFKAFHYTQLCRDRLSLGPDLQFHGTQEGLVNIATKRDELLCYYILNIIIVAFLCSVKIFSDVSTQRALSCNGLNSTNVQ